MGIREMFSLARVPSILMLGAIYVTYVLIGGVVFWKLEGDLGQKDISRLLLKKKRMLMTYTCLNQEGLEEVAQVRHRNMGYQKKRINRIKFYIPLSALCILIMQGSHTKCFISNTGVSTLHLAGAFPQG